MRHKTISILLATALVVIPSLSVFAISEDWRFSKSIKLTDEQEIKAIFLDEDIYRGSKNDLSDIRILNDKDEFVPFYIYDSSFPITESYQDTFSSEIISSHMNDNDHYSDYKVNSLGGNIDIIGNALVLYVDGENFYKDVRVLGSYDNKSWDYLKSDNIYSIDGRIKNMVSLGSDYKYNFYRIISINDLSGLPVSDVSIVYNNSETTYEDYEKSKKIELLSTSSNKETVINIDNKDRLKIKNISLKSTDDFNREYNVYISDGDTTSIITSGTIKSLNLNGHTNDNVDISFEGTRKGYTTAEFLKIVISDKDDKPISFTEMKIGYQVDKIVFNGKGIIEARILFGNPKAQAPSYDISTYIKEIENSEQEVVSLLNLVESDKEAIVPDPINLEIVLNIIVVIISLTLVMVIIKKK